MANELKQVYGSATTVIDLTADLTNTSVAGGTAALDNTTNHYPWALAVFNAPGTFSAAPTNLSTVNLYMVRQNVDSTSDDTAAPTGTDVESAQFVGAFLVYDTDEDLRDSSSAALRRVTNALFYIENKTGVTITGSGSHIYVKVTPFSSAPT